MPWVRHSICVLGPILMILGFFCGCEKQPTLPPDQTQIMDNCISLFTRLKVHDNAAIYDNEFPYMREERDREEYLSLPAIAAYRSDTLQAIQIDSITAWDDTAYTYMQLEYVLSDSTTVVRTVTMRWHRADGVWIKPTLSNSIRQREFEEELRVYWEAVREIEAREKERQKQQEKPVP